MNATNTLPVVKSNYAVNGSLIVKQIKAIGGMAGVLDSKLHATLVASYAHALPPVKGGYGDTRYLTALLNAAGKAKSLRVHQMVRYLSESGPLNIAHNKETNTFAVSYKKKYSADDFKLPGELDAKPFYKIEERTAYAFDLMNSLDKVLSAGNRQLKHIKEANALSEVWQNQLADALKMIESVKNHAVDVAAKSNNIGANI